MNFNPQLPPERPRRLPYAAGDGLTRYLPGPESPYSLRVDCPWEKPWKAREPGGLTSAPHPGTAILFEGALYEVVHAEAGAEGRSAFLYMLAPWEEEAAPPRQVVEYSIEAAERAAEERREAHRRLRRAHGLNWLSPFVGLLPAADQYRIQRDYGISAQRASQVSALVFLVVAALGVILGVAAMLAKLTEARRGIPWDALLPLASYLMLESFVRLGAATYTGEPVGAAFVSLPVMAWQAVAAAIAAVRSEKVPRRRRTAADSARLLHEARDEVTVLPEEKLEILSELDKPHWSLVTGVHFEERWYRLETREVVERGARRLYRFVLAEAPDAQLLRKLIGYRPEEVREIHRQVLLFQKRTWVETFAPIWGLLDAELQNRLAEQYEFDASRHTAWSAVGVALLGLWDGAVAVSWLAARRGGLADILMLFVAAYLLAESASRLRRARAGEGAGSVLGWLLAPLGRRLVV